MSLYSANIFKYPPSITLYLMSIDNSNKDEDAWTFTHKTEKERRKWFFKLFNGVKENYIPFPFSQN